MTTGKMLLQRPERQLGQTLGLSSRVAIADDQFRRQGLCLGDIYTDAHVKLFSFDIERGASPGGDASHDFLLRRSVAPRKEKRDDRCHDTHQFKICAFSGAASDEFDQQAGPAKAGRRQDLLRQDGDPPAADAGRRLPEIPGLGLSVPLAWRQTDGVGSIWANYRWRDAVIERRAVSATTAPSPPWRNPS